MSGRGRTWKSDWSDWKDSNHGSEDSARWWAEKRWGQKKTQKSWKWEEDSGEEATNDGWGDDDWNEPKGDQSDWKQQHWKAHDNRSVSSWKNWDQSWEDHDKGDDNKSKSTVTTSHRGSFFRLGGLLSTGGRFSSSGGVEGEGDWEETEEDISRKWNADEEDADEEAPHEKPRLPTTPKAPLPPTPPPAAPIGASLKPKPKVPPKMRPTSPKHPPKAKAGKPGESGAPALKPRPKARPVQPAKAPPAHTWEETSSEDDWADGETRPGGKGWTPTSGQAPPKPKPMPKPPKEPPPKHLLTEPPKAKEDLTLTADVEDFLKSLDVNEEASRALREAPQEVQRMMLQEVQDIPAGRSASAAVKFRVQRFSRIFKQSEAKAAKGSPPSVPPQKPPEPPGPPPGHMAKAVPMVPGPPPGPPPKGQSGASPPPPPPEDGEDSGEEWPKKTPAKPKPPPPPAPPPAAPPAAPPAPPPPKQQPNAAAANTAAAAANTAAAKTGQSAVPAEQWQQQQQQQIWQQQQQQWQQWQVPVATFQPVMGQLNMMAMTMQNLAKMAMAPMTGTTETAGAAGNSKSGGAEQAIKVYAEEEAKKFVALHCLSKETEEELLTLSPEDMLNITQSSKNKVDADTPQSKRNADGMEDLVVMSRIRRLKGKESTEEAKKEDAKEEKKIPSKEKKEAKVEKDALPSEVEAQLKKKVSQQSHTLLFAQRAVEFVRQHQLHTLAERALMMMAATDGEILMKSRSVNFDRHKGLRAKMRHFFYLVKCKDKSGEVEAMVSYAWDLIKKQVCPEETSRSRSKERPERHSRTHHSPKRRSRSRRTRGENRGRRSSRRRRSRSRSSQRRRSRAKRAKRSKSKSKVSSSSSPKAKAKEKAGKSESSSSSDEADRLAAAAATVAKLQEPSAPPKAAGTVPVAAPKGKVAAKSVSFGARSKAKSSPGDGRNHVKKVAAAFSHDDLEVEVQAMNHEESLKAARAAKLAEEQRRSKIEFQIKSSSDPVARMLKLKESLETKTQPEAAEEGAPGPPSEAPPEEAPEPPPPPEETPEDIDGMPWQEEEEEEEAQEEAEVVPQGEHEQAAWDWLKNLDGGRGSLLKYFEVMRDEFDCDFAQLAAARLETPVGPGALGHLEPSFFEALGVEQIGHRLLLARGILALEQQ